MITLLNLNIGMPVEVEGHSQLGERGKYKSKIIDFRSDYIFIQEPVNLETLRPHKLKEDGLFIITVIAGNQLYKFKSHLAGTTDSPVSMAIFKLPSPSAIETIQRRSYFRIEAAIDVAVHPENESLSPFTTVTSDLSGGGMSFIIPQHVSLEAGMHLQFHLVLPMETGELAYARTGAEVVRVIERKGKILVAATKFTGISSDDRQSIMQYCYARQRQLLKTNQS